MGLNSGFPNDQLAASVASALGREVPYTGGQQSAITRPQGQPIDDENYAPSIKTYSTSQYQ